LRDNLGRLEVTLGPDQLEKRDASSKIDLGFPHDFLLQARSYIFTENVPVDR